MTDWLPWALFAVTYFAAGVVVMRLFCAIQVISDGLFMAAPFVDPTIKARKFPDIVGRLSMRWVFVLTWPYCLFVDFEEDTQITTTGA
jgi:hypothetical protein